MLTILNDFYSDDHECSYLPDQVCSMRYRQVEEMDEQTWGALLRRGWRRFGDLLFRPQCPSCQECRSLRVVVDQFRPTKSQRRVLRKNERVRCEIGLPEDSASRIRLFNDYHAFMHETHSWPMQRIDQEEYRLSFLGKMWPFAREIRYFDADRLVGVGLVDVVPDAMSSIYFYHDPEWRSLGPGTFSVLNELQICRDLGCRYLYLGYCVEDSSSMSYKSRFQPHEILDRIVDLDEEPSWIAVAQDQND